MIFRAEIQRLDGQLDQAAEDLEVALQQSVALGVPGFTAECLLSLAAIAGTQGDMATMNAHALMAHELFARYRPERVAELLQVQGLALVSGSERERERGVALLLRAVEMREEQLRKQSGSREWLSQARESYARGLLAVDRAAEASELLDLALKMHQEEFGHGTWRTRAILMQKFLALVELQQLDNAEPVGHFILNLAREDEAWARYCDDTPRHLALPGRAQTAARAGPGLSELGLVQPGSRSWPSRPTPRAWVTPTARTTARAERGSVLARTVDAAGQGTATAALGDFARQRLAGSVNSDRGVVGRDALLGREVLDRDAIDLDPPQSFGIFGLECSNQLAHTATADVDGIERGLAWRNRSLGLHQAQRPLTAITAAMALDARISQYSIEPCRCGRGRSQLRQPLGALGKRVLQDVLGQGSIANSALEKRQELAALGGELLQESGCLRAHGWLEGEDAGLLETLHRLWAGEHRPEREAPKP